VPVPEIGTVCGLPAALSVRMNVADRAPAAVGWNVTAMTQLAPTGSVRPEQPSLVWVKSSGCVPRVAALLMNSGALPVLATVTDCGALRVPVSCGPKVSEDGENVTGADAGGGGGGGAGGGGGDAGGGGGGGAGGGGVVVEQPDSVAVAEVEPSLTVTRHVGEL
jgi:uncharacterized membrane protein YgcG